MNKHTLALVPTLLLVLVAVFSCNLPRIAPAGPTPTPSATATATATTTLTASATPFFSATPTATFTPSPTLTPSATATPTITPFALDPHAELDRYMYVDQMAQRMYIFEHGELIRTMLVSTGLPDTYTSTPKWEGQVGWFVGSFFSFGTYADEAWFLFNDGFLIHGQPYLLNKEGNKVYQDSDAQGVRPASHGCIRLFPEDAEWLSAWNPSGVLITISDPNVDYWRVRLAELKLTPSPTLSATPEVSATPEPSATPSPEPTQTETPTPTLAATATAAG